MVRTGLVRLGIRDRSDPTGLAVASRTDRGVSARGNALAISSVLPPAALLRALNGISPEVWFTHLAPIPEDFRPRNASQRWYRYWERRAIEVPASWTEAARSLEGRVDARSFGRGLPANVPTWREIDRVEPTIDHGWLVVDVRARSFVWGMVRKIIGALREVEAGSLALGTLGDAVAGRHRLSVALAEPDRLVLWETIYPIPWELERSALTAQQERHRRATLESAAARHEIWSRMGDRPTAPIAERAGSDGPTEPA